MKPKPLSRFPWSCTTEVQQATIGHHIREALDSSMLPAKSPLQVIKASLTLPAGAGFLRALRRSRPQADPKFPGYLRMASPMPRHQDSAYTILVPNFLNEVTEEAIRAFYRTSDDDLIRQLGAITGTIVVPSRTRWRDLANILDATTMGTGFPASLISYVNFVDNFAIPSPRLTRHKKSAIPKLQKTPVFRTVVEELLLGSDDEQLKKPDVLRQEYLSRAASCSHAERALIRAAVYYAFEFTPERAKWGRFLHRVEPGSDRTYLNSLPRAFHLLTKGELIGLRDGPLDVAIFILRNAAVITQEHPNAASHLDTPRSVWRYDRQAIDSPRTRSSLQDAGDTSGGDRNCQHVAS